MDLQKEYREKAEAILFSSGKLMKFEEIARVGRFRNLELLKQTLLDLRDDYEHRNGPIKIENHEELWKMSVNERHAETVKKIVPTTELPRSITETLAVIAFKYPIMQSDLIKIRSNKGYEHLEELEKIGFISRQKYGRTRLIKLTPKFFEYFNLPEGKIKEQFKDFEQIAASLEKKEEEMANEKEIKIEPYEEKLGDLDVFDEGKKSVHHTNETKEKKEPEQEEKKYSDELKEDKKEERLEQRGEETEEKQEADAGKFFDKQKEKRNRKKHNEQEIQEDKNSEEDLSYEHILKEVKQEELGEKQEQKPKNLEEEIEKKSDEIAEEIMRGEKSEEEQKESEEDSEKKEEGSDESEESDNKSSDEEAEEQTEEIEEEQEEKPKKSGRKKKS